MPVVRVECSGDGDCGVGECSDGVCNHLDADNDSVGDPCDTCPAQPNSKQVLDGGMQEDDADGDFMGGVCETAPACATRSDPDNGATFCEGDYAPGVVQSTCP